MKTTSSFKAGDIVCPISADYTFGHGELVLPDGSHVRHDAKFNATIISRFIIATEDLAEGQEVLVDLNTFVYESVEGEEMHIPGFKNLPDVEKQRLYIYADERVRQQAITDGFIPRRSESEVDVVRTINKSRLVTVSRGNHEAQSVVFTSTGVLLPFPVRSTIELPGERHLRLTGGSEFIRHACQPNLCLKIDGDCIRAIALRPIEDGEQLTCNYLYTEWDIAQPFCCACNTYSCYGFIRGFRYLDAEQQMHLLPHASAAIQEKYNAPSLSGASLTFLKENTAVSLTFEGKVAAQRYIPSGTVLFHVNRFRVQPREVIIDDLQIPHSCDANTILLEGRLVATQPLLPGDFITLNISTLFYEIPLPFDCLCGSHNCIHLVKGFSSLSDSEKNRLMTFTDISVLTEALRNGYSIESSSPLVKITKDPLIGYVTSAEHFIPKGTRIFHVNGFVLPFPTVYTVFLGEGKHLLFSEGAQCLGHSCEPNTRLYVDASNGIVDCVATRDIQPGEYVSFNYLTSEWDMAVPFKCRCGSSSCHAVIKGFRHLDERTQLKLWTQATTGVKLLFKHHRRSALPTLSNSLVTLDEDSGDLCVARDMPSGIILFEATNFTVIGDEIVLDDIRIKHSCNPTAVWLDGKVVLCRASLRGDAVTLNINHLIYSTTPFECICGSSNCVKRVCGFEGLTEDEKEIEMLYVDPQVRATAVNNGYCIKSSSPLVEVKANGRMGQATFAKADIVKGTRFFNVTGLVIPFPTIYTILIADKQHLLFSDGAQCLAHSCDPNVRIIVDNTARRIECIALRDIKKDELISFNYLTTEWDMQTPFTCLCGSANCYHDIRGFKYLQDELRQNLWSITTPAIASLAANEKGVDAWMQIASERLFLENDGSVHIGDNMKEGVVLINVSSVEIRNRFLYIDGLRLGHHCSPTAALIEDKIVLIRTVNRGDELTVDLNCVSYAFSEEFICNCNRFKPEHIIKGFKYLEEREKCSRIAFTELSVRSAALNDGYKLDCSSPTSSLIEVRKGNTGMEAYARTNISSGRRFMNVTGLCLPFPTVGTVQLDEKKHLLLSDGAEFILHSCNPNTRMCVEAVNNRITCEALRDIENGELITFNYLTTEWELRAPFRCQCESSECLHDIRGFKFLTGAQRMDLQHQVTPFMRHMTSTHTIVHLPSFLKKNTNGMLQLTNTVTRGTVLLESSDVDIQPTQVSFGGDAYIIQHNANPNAVFVEGRFIALRTIEESEVITVNMNLFVYDMKILFPYAFAEGVKGFRYLEDEEKQRKLYLCEPPVRAQAMRDGWIVKSTSPLIEVHPNGKMGQTAYAVKDIAQGEKLFHVTGLVVPFPTMYTICVGESKHLLFGDAAECIAHHCEPNVQVTVHEEDDSLEFITIKPISAGEMVTFNYCSTEWYMNTPFVCLCGSTHCAQTIRGFSHLSNADRQRIWPITSTVVRRYASREGH
ncbi:SET domain [Trypanosoma melophagium]|uniref:SET domain n=1 Tax=Trypanosoma melophagium TaxID=715481 RepID=UPI00351A6833|nr:SET domain [Trypanosoma melophagium]